MVLDDIDLRILSLLQRDGKMTIKEVASQLSLTMTPVYERIRKMEREGVIRKYMALLDRKKLGYEMLVFCEVSLKSHSIEYIQQFTESIAVVHEVVECYHIAGRYDFLLKVVVKTMDDYQKFVLTRLSSLDNIGRVQSLFVLREVFQPRPELAMTDQ